MPYAATAPLPPGIGELLMAGFLNRGGIRMVNCVSNRLWVPANAEIVADKKGAALTNVAFQAGGYLWFRWILYAAVVLFAFSTLISWSYYGERCFTHLFGRRASIVYKVLFLMFTVLGSIVTPLNILNFSDILILSLSIPNVLGLYILSGKVRRGLDDYWERYTSGKLEQH